MSRRRVKAWLIAGWVRPSCWATVVSLRWRMAPSRAMGSPKVVARSSIVREMRGMLLVDERMNPARVSVFCISAAVCSRAAFSWVASSLNLASSAGSALIIRRC